MKILMTGNPQYGLAESWKKRHAGTYNVSTGETYHTNFASRHNDYDLSIKEHQKRLAKDSLDYDVFINNSALHEFNQLLLFKRVFDLWHEHNKPGRIINVGSTIDRSAKATTWLYPIEKKTLQTYSSQASQLSIWAKEIPVMVSYISFGSLATKAVDQKHPDRVLMPLERACEVIKFILDQPKETLISEIRIDQVQ